MVHGLVDGAVGGISLSSRFGQVDQSKLFRGGLAGEESPQIDGELPGDGHNRLLSGGGTAAGIAQHRHPLLQPVVVGLPAHHPPDHLHEHGSDSGGALLAHAASSSLAATAVFPRTEARVARDLSPIGEARPVADLPAQYLKGQGAYAPGDLRLRANFLDRLGHRLLLGLHRCDQSGEHLQPLNDPLGCLFNDELPRLARPPLAGDVDAVGGQQASSHRLKALTFTDDLLALTGESPVAFFLLARHAHDTESLAVAEGEAVEPLADGEGVKALGLIRLWVFIVVRLGV